MNIYSQENDKVKFLGKNGFDRELEMARGLLSTEIVYTVDCVDVGGWISYVYLKEIPDKSFNTVMFENF